jgi:hypothetical protein
MVLFDRQGKYTVAYEKKELGTGTLSDGTIYFLGEKTFAAVDPKHSRVVCEREDSYRNGLDEILPVSGRILGGVKGEFFLFLVDAATGAIVGRITSPRSFDLYGIRIIGDRILALQRDRTIALIDAASRTIVDIISSPLATQTITVLGDYAYWVTPAKSLQNERERELVAFNLNGRVEHVVPIPVSWPFQIVGWGDRLLVAGDGMACFSRADLDCLWSYKDREMHPGSMLVGGDFLALSVKGEEIECYDLEALERLIE